ncbi:hypothetical protein PIB30_091674 [Stylosanthes scabra]|uniref:Uncharacterized protein n=1 Tax=Stylosanthes scabra TaxID=79078 RepID=A0ABU6WUB0_9FABA|nr:hypothetical protein [Stylosanthes scabra]
MLLNRDTIHVRKHIRLKVAEPPHSSQIPFKRIERIGLRIDSESILQQFSTVHRRLQIAITFDPELRLTHRLRLLEAYSILFDSTPHLRYGYHEILLISSF